MVLRSSDEDVKGAFTKVRSIGVFSLGAVAFFNISGGPFGSEEMFSSGGPLWGIIGMVLGLLCWSVPMSFMTAELSSAFPYNGGYSLWVKAAFGKFWGVQESYWSWVSGVVDNAVYPVIIIITSSSLLPFIPLLPSLSYQVIIFQTISSVAPDTFGAMSDGLLQMSIFVSIPFVVFIIWGLTKADLSVLGESKPLGDIDWVNWAIVCFWNFSGVDCVSTVAGEVKRPEKTVIRALLGCVIIVFLQYFLVLATAAGIDGENWQYWSAGSLSGVGMRAFGTWFGWWLVVASIVGSAGQFVAELLEDSYQICGMARFGLAPKWFGYLHPTYRTPWVAIFFQVVVICVLVSFDFNTILSVDSFMACLSNLLEFFSLLKLRWSRPEMSRPYRIPVKSFWGLLVAMSPPLIYGGFIVVVSFIAGWLTLGLNCAALAVGLVLGWLAVRHSDKLGFDDHMGEKSI
ncbi:amino acid transporter, putative [Perkinsus marinus ATCC 50983]|uniref:Amino acid transporter, putative n=1 Tax=Perkinsus marinus (strain ATCC 50983 / TXsc) TaxID=423536 RepID=C5KTK3_PERM5|nr:amino acid transporter, putative [Perkinsus marinus ATCC 50983]EER12182.1 amino acid transporter, putative [Perkinsus marinus ATCC 50983]|eukprot:XP_002780387.1 amino acid transporter, putative [Perkinsus marinus ATCC 50983]